jgi:hypothetical protein
MEIKASPLNGFLPESVFAGFSLRTHNFKPKFSKHVIPPGA